MSAAVLAVDTAAIMRRLPAWQKVSTRSRSSRISSDNFNIGVADGYGVLVEVRDGQVHLHGALYDGSSGPFPRLDLQVHCGVLDEKLKAFARRFIR